MSSRILIPLAVAAALMSPLTASAEQGDWLFRVGMSQLDPDSTTCPTLPAATSSSIATSSPTFNVAYMLTDHISTELLPPGRSRTAWI